MPGKAICHFLLGLKKTERKSFTEIYQIFASYPFLFKAWVWIFFLFLDQCHSLDFWTISPPSHREKLFFIEILVTVKGIVLVTADRISSLHIHSQLLFSPLESIFTRSFKFLIFKNISSHSRCLQMRDFELRY